MYLSYSSLARRSHCVVFLSKDKREEVYAREAAELLAEISSSLQDSGRTLQPAAAHSAKIGSFLLRRLATVQTLRTAIRLQRQAVQNNNQEAGNSPLTQDRMESHSQKALSSARRRLRKNPSMIVPMSAAKIPRKNRNKRKVAARPARPEPEDLTADERDDDVHDVEEYNGDQGTKTPTDSDRHQKSCKVSNFTASATAHSDDSDENNNNDVDDDDDAHSQAIRRAIEGHDEVTYEPAVSRVSVRSKSESLTLTSMPKRKRSNLPIVRWVCTVAFWMLFME